MPDINTVVVTPSVSVVAVNSSVPGSFDSVARLGLGWFNVVEYGAVGDGSTDDYAAIVLANAAALAAAGSVSAGYPAKEVTLYFPAGRTFASASPLVFSDLINVQMDGRVVYTGSSNVAAITYGSLTPSDPGFTRQLKFRVARSTQSDWTSESNIGVHIINTYQSYIYVAEARNFTIGVQMMGDSTGCVYNEVHLGHILNNKVGLNLTNDDTSSVGWCNENVFIGGRFANDTGVNPTLQRWGIRITSDSTTKYYNNNNVFYKPSIELNNAGSGTCTPIYIPYGDYNHFHDARQESNDSPRVVVENESKSNQTHFGFSEGASSTSPITDDGTYPSTYVTQGQRIKLEQPSRLVFQSGALHKLACYSDGGTNINVPTVHLGTTSGGDTLFTAQTGLTLNADYLELSTTRAVGVFVDTRNNKEFVVRRDVTGSANGGRIAIACFNSSGTHLVNTDPGHPYVKGLSFSAPSYSTNYGGVYQTGSDSDDDYYFKVGSDVAWVRILCGGGSAAPRIRSFAVFAVGSFAAPAAWTGVDEIIPGVNTGTTYPTSGTWTKGRVVMNVSPDEGEPLGWVCVIAGSPGTWLPFGQIGGSRQQVEGWYQDNVVASQTTVELTRAMGRFTAVRGGSVTGVGVIASEARTAGTLTVEVYKNTGVAGAAGSGLGLTAVLNGSNTTKKQTTQVMGTDTYAAGDELYCVVTTDGSWLPVTSDIRAVLEVTETI